MEFTFQEAVNRAPPMAYPLLPWEEGLLGIVLGGQDVLPIPEVMQWLGPVPPVPGGRQKEPDDLTDIEEEAGGRLRGRGVLATMDRRRTVPVDLASIEDVKRRRVLEKWLQILHRLHMADSAHVDSG